MPKNCDVPLGEKSVVPGVNMFAALTMNGELH
jgi:hypothetical protein